MDEFSARLREADAAIVAQPGYAAYCEWQSLRTTHAAVFVANRRDLLTLLHAASNDIDLAIELVQNARETDVLERFLDDVVQRLHNYVAGAATLVDHTRRLVARYGETDFGIEYQQRRARVADAPETALIGGLRNFMLHRALPVLRHSLSFSNVNTSQQEVTSETELSVSALLEWDGWNSSARTYLNTGGSSLALRPLIEAHGLLVDDLMSWMLGCFDGLHGDEVSQVNILISRRNAILAGSDEAG